jgi:hypothetical protein
MNSTDAGMQIEDIDVKRPKVPMTSREMAEPGAKTTDSIDSGFGKSRGNSLVSDAGTMNLWPWDAGGGLSSGDESALIEFNGRSI